MNYFEALASVNVNDHVEKKGRFTYLSWPFAMAQLAKKHPNAIIEVRDWDGFPAIRGVKGWMVCVSVTIDDVKRTQWHPVLDNNNRAILEPSVFEINTSIQRGMVKAIALHGLGLYIYAGEDLPDAPTPEPKQGQPLSGVWEACSPELQEELTGVATNIQEYFDQGDMSGLLDYVEGKAYDVDTKSALWTQLNSKVRSAIKAETAKRKAS